MYVTHSCCDWSWNKFSFLVVKMQKKDIDTLSFVTDMRLEERIFKALNYIKNEKYKKENAYELKQRKRIILEQFLEEHEGDTLAVIVEAPRKNDTFDPYFFKPSSKFAQFLE